MTFQGDRTMNKLFFNYNIYIYNVGQPPYP